MLNEMESSAHVQIYVMNAGPNRRSSFHVVGGLAEQAFIDGAGHGGSQGQGGEADITPG